MQSSQDFVRALKATGTTSSFKIDLARNAWNDKSFYVPNKEDIISEWILTTFTKEKSKAIAESPVLDKQYWELLASLLKGTSDAKGATEVQTLKWIKPLLLRFPILPIILTFLSNFQMVLDIEREPLFNAFSDVISSTWSIASQKITTENLQECFGCWLANEGGNAAYKSNALLGRLIAVSYKNSLQNSSNKKKLYSSFLSLYLLPWLSFVNTHQTTTDADYLAVLDAGTDTIFNLDILRQNLDTTSDSALIAQLVASTENHPQMVLGTLAFIFQNYIASIKKHRGALFSQGSQHTPGATLEELREAGMRFFKSCIGLLDGVEDSPRVWSNKAALLETVDRENLFSHRHQDARIALNSLQENALAALGNSPSDVQTANVIIECLTTVAKIDYDLLIPFLPRILPKLLWVTSESQVTFDFLEELLKYHTKTRTMNTLIESLFSAFKVQEALPTSIQDAYQTELSSPLVHMTFLDRLAKSIQTFMTESQASPMVTYITNFLLEEWSKCQDTAAESPKKEKEDGRPKKKQRKSDVTKMDIDDDSPSSSAASSSAAVLTFCLGARLSAVVLTSLPLRSLSPMVLEEVNTLSTEFREGFLAQTSLKAVKAVKKNASWGAEVTLASFLRILYALDVSKGQERMQQDKLYKKLVEIVEDDDRLPELVLEIFRYLLHGATNSEQEFGQKVIQLVLHYLVNNFSSSSVHWSGEAHRLGGGQAGKAKGALALLHMLVERWLPVINHYSSKEQLEHFIKVILRITPPTTFSPSQDLYPEHILLQLLTAAEFWELKNIRAVFLDILDRETSTSSKNNDNTISLYYLLLYFPLEYFTFQLLHDLFKRAWALDLSLGQHINKKKKSSGDDTLRAHVVLRVFLKRAASHSGHLPLESGEEIADILVHLMQEPMGGPDETYVKATVDLVAAYVGRLFKASTKSGSQPLQRVLQQFPTTLFDEPHGVRTKSFNKLVQILTEEASETRSSSISAEIMTSLRNLDEQLCKTLLPKLESGVDNVELIEGWQGLLKLNTWLNVREGKSQVIPHIGIRLASKLISHKLVSVKEQAFLSTLAVLLQELGYKSEAERPRHLESVIACYIAFSNVVSNNSLKPLDEELGKTIRKLVISDYVHLLDVVLESLSSRQSSSSANCVHVVHLATVLLREHPSHSLAHIQKFVFACLSVFNSNDVFVNTSAQLRWEVLDLVSSYCIIQQGALRPVDISSIWLLLSKFLAPSHIHDEKTDTAVFHKITTIVSSLVRFRRDLVTQTIPHLGMILRQLILSMRACHPNLGAKQTNLIMNTQPRWISSTQPLQPEDAKALSRLLESLNAKTTIKTLSTVASSTQPQKAESLSKPFSKHAVYVLKAYVEVMNDPFCALGLEVRKAIEAGLFVLCGMVNEHGRDALMVSGLDAGGKLILKALWKEYEKQRYVGKG
ncbi:hypothetical protein CVT24_006058 [Panaeolus cyanescens]|uniref:Nucleolar 27S pre-rRNA processing Urb2/Npa2 C-terminal domain-containing protein n=1 Tax=Panaeolus cyanescens TaxID=181874 RepID=A0A409YDT8_9AGAR|nr:hypothetical protein CVT24_006058 [Panaeolus cyanescens]